MSPLAYPDSVWYTIYVMKTAYRKPKGVYVQVSEAPGRGKTKSISLPGWSIARTIRELVKAHRNGNARVNGNSREDEPAVRAAG